MKSAVARAIGRGVEFLATAQHPDGSFTSYSSPYQSDFSRAREYRTTFFGSLILSSLAEVSVPGVGEVRERAAGFLLEQKGEEWSFNYWARNTPEAIIQPYPDDIDDTFCALAALYRHDASLITPTTVAAAVKLLIAVEVEEGGPYRTWLVQADADRVWRDVDLAINANVAYFLRQQGVELPRVTVMMERAIESAAYRSSYYPSAFPIIYSIARAYQGTKSGQMGEYLLDQRQPDGSWGNPLDTALAVSALLHMGAHPIVVEPAIEYLVGSQHRGSWPAQAFCLDPAVRGQPHYAGAPALTTALVLEALALYQAAQVKPVPKPKPATEFRTIRRTVVARVEQRLGKLDNDLRRQAEAALDQMMQQDKELPIILLPYYFGRALGKGERLLPRHLLAELGLAGLYGWMAYTIYDDFLDEEGDPQRLSVANLALRELSLLFHNILPDSPAFRRMATRVLDRIDAANTWETVHCRAELKDGWLRLAQLPDYGDFGRLADRSLGHALGPLAILFNEGHTAGSAPVRQTLKFFRHYLIARQLNDDAHDWEADLRRGQINAVGAWLLHDEIKRGRLKQTDHRWKVEALIPRLQKRLWEDKIAAISDQVLTHVALARRALRTNTLLADTAGLETMLTPIEAAALTAQRERERVGRFLEAYSGA